MAALDEDGVRRLEAACRAARTVPQGEDTQTDPPDSAADKGTVSVRRDRSQSGDSLHRLSPYRIKSNPNVFVPVHGRGESDETTFYRLADPSAVPHSATYFGGSGQIRLGSKP